MKNLCVIIPTFKRPEYLNRTLASLTNQATTADYGVLVVDDDGADPRTKHIAEFWGSRGPVRYCTPGSDPSAHGRTRIRNFGIQNADAEILIFLDDDMLVPPNFIEEHWRSHEKSSEDTVVIGYRYHLKVSPNFLEHISPLNLASHTIRFSELPAVEDEREDIYQLCQSNLNSLPTPWVTLYSNNFSVRRDFLKKAGGGFDETFQGAWGGEDVELGYRLHRSKASFILNRRAIGYHQWHYANWRRNMQSLYKNLHRFFLLHPKIETELYVNYPETGLKTYLKDLRKYRTQGLQGGDAAKNKVVIQKVLSRLGSSDNGLLIGVGNGKALYQTARFNSFSDPRDQVHQDLKTKGGPSGLHLVGCHLPFEGQSFDHVVVTDYVRGLSAYHRGMVFQEALRLSKNNVLIIVPLNDLKRQPNETEQKMTISQRLAVWAGITLASYSLDLEIVDGVLIASLTRSLINVMDHSKPISRLALIIPSESEDSHSEQAIELALALSKAGGDIAIQLEDQRLQRLVYSEKIEGMKRFDKEEQRFLKMALTKDLRGRNHLYPRLSLTGNYHYHGKRVDWIMDNKIGLLSSPYVQVLNDESDSLWISSSKVAHLFRQSGVQHAKIKEVPIALPDHMVNGFIPDRPDKAFRFVAIGTVEKVDGLDLAIEAFCLAAKSLPHAELVVRIFPIESREALANDLRHNLTVRLSHRKHLEDVVAIQQYRIRKWIKFVQERGLARRVIFENLQYRFRQWPGYLEDANCLIQSQRVDVMGQWVLRAMALRIPVVSSGRYLPEDLKARWMNYFIENKEISAADREWASNVVYTRWAEPKADSLLKNLKHVYRNRKEAWRRSDLAQGYVKRRLTWKTVVHQYVNDLGKLFIPTARDSSIKSQTLFDDLKKHNLINLEEEPFERR